MEEATCYFCGHKQKTKSKLDRITCSDCGKKFYKSGNPNPEMPDASNPQPINKEARPVKVALD